MAEASSGGERVREGEAALARGAWDEARTIFDEELEARETVDALEGLSWAAWWVEDVPVCVEARERAFRLSREQGDLRRAAMIAVWLGNDYLVLRGERAVANGWFQRAARILDGLDPCPEHGWLDALVGYMAMAGGESAKARELAVGARAVGRQFGVVGLEMFALSVEGVALVNEGDVAEGLRCLDEATAAALAGDFEQIVPAGWTCCLLLNACERVRDYERAAEWCSKVEEFGRRKKINFVTGACRAHYGALLTYQGRWGEADRELTEATDYLLAQRPTWSGLGIVRLAELRRRQGRIAEAQELLGKAEGNALTPVVLADIALDLGDAAAAVDLLEPVLRRMPTENRSMRAAPLEVMVRAKVGSGEAEAAASLLVELRLIAEAVGTRPLRALLSFCEGLVAAAAGDPELARERLEDAVELFVASGAALELARARLELARVLASLGRQDAAVREATLALERLDEIGAQGEAARARELLRSLGASPEDGESAAELPAQAPPAAGDVAAALPAYEVREELGHGAWGVVLAGRHRRLGREVAIKQLPATYASDPDVRARFLAEGQRLASLDHPHIVPVYDYVEHGSLCLLVMERLHGGTVADLARRERLAPPVACGLALAACSALQHAHERGLLHRDIKPENMLFAASGALKVADFGIAKVLGGAATLATAEGAMLGTPAFMAPEQVQGGELTPATDVYALGTTLYQLLAGRLPFPFDGEVANFLFRRVHEPPLPLRSAEPALPVELCDVVDAALVRDPGGRIASAQDLGVALAGAAVQAWGSGWLDASGVVLASAGPIADAARGAAGDSPLATVVSRAPAGDLDRGRELCETGSWGAALDTLSTADGVAPLQPADLELLATCAYMLGDVEDYLKTMERAHHGYVDAGDRLRAAHCASWMMMHLFTSGQYGRAGGWQARAERLVEQEGGESALQGYLLLPSSFQAAAGGGSAEAAAIAGKAADIGERFGDADLVGLSLSVQGQCLIDAGAIADGLRRLDEAMVAIETGELTPMASGIVYCGVVLACQDAHEVRRAREWTRALTAWCEAQPDMVAFTGRCRLHRAELMQLEGAWPDAIDEAERARVRSEQSDNQRSAGAADYVRGEVWRLCGDLDAAEQAFREASGRGWDPQPGLALLWLARGDVDDAAAAMRRARSEASNVAASIRLLPAHVEVMLEVGDLDAARAAAGELQAIASGHDEGMLAALAAEARGRVDLADGKARSALASLRSALASWQDLGAPYQAARARVLIGAACGALGDERSAELEVAAARAGFERLGARRDIARVGAPLEDQVERGRALYDTGTWRGAYETLSTADSDAPLAPEDLERMARAAYMLGRDDDYAGGLERAHHAYLESGDTARAANCAFWIGHMAMFRGDFPRGQGWMQRAQRLLDGADDCAERGYLLIPAWLQQMGAGDFEAGFATAGQAAEIGERFGDVDLIWLARMDQGRARVQQGRTQDGLRLVDEALVAATAGELSPIVTGIVYCNVIIFCRDSFELRHAHAWTEALTRWCEAQPEMVAHNGLCLVHRAEMIQLRGSWGAALAEAERVTERFTEGMLNKRALGVALYRQGEMHRLLGQLAEAEGSYTEASRLGFEPQPGLALLRLAQGKPDAAAAAIRRAAMETTKPLGRAALLPAQVEIMLAVGDVEEARDACGELEEIAERQGSEALQAMASQARGATALADGDAPAALVALRRAWQAWHELEAPYEGARARELLGLACRAVGDEDSATLELDAAREAFERLGAATDLARLDAHRPDTPTAPDPAIPPPVQPVAKVGAERLVAEGERKQVTVLFADLVGSMELQQRMDVEEWRALMERVVQILSVGVQSFEGMVDKFTGDGIMAIFGAPIACEDHARRACYAALHMQRELALHAAQRQRDNEVAISVRIGIHSGDVVVGTIGENLAMSYTAVGYTVSLAKRMEELASPDGISVSPETASLVEGYLALRERGEFEIKGARDPMTVYELTGVGPARGALDVARGRGLSRLVGRDEELRTLEVALENAFSGQGQVIGIVGEAGLGKSRLCHELSERCRVRGVPVYRVAGLAHARTVPLMPLLQLLRDYFEITEADSEQTARERIASTLRPLDAAFDAELPLLYDFLAVPDPERPVERMDPEARQRRLLLLMKSVTHAQSAREPGLTVIEDLHWLDPATEAFLASHVEAVQGTRGLTVLNYRPEYQAAWMSRSFYRQIALGPLGEEAVEALLAERLGSDPSLAGLNELIRERTQGNPFFIEELVRSLAEARSIAGEPGAHRLVRPIDKVVVPATVQAVLAARIDRLGPREKAVLQAAAVVGKEFPQPILERVAGLAAQEMEAVLAQLVASEFVYEQEPFPEQLFAFKHPLTQEVAYGSQLSAHRADVHAAVAQATVERYPDRLEERAALVARHWEAAGENLEAVRWYARAAAWSGYNDPVEALRHWRKVRELSNTSPDSEEAAELGLSARLNLLNYGWRVGISAEEAQAAFDEGERMTSERGDVRSLAVLLATYGAVRGYVHGEIREMAELTRRAFALAEESGDPAIYMTIAPTAYSLFLIGEYRAGAAMLDRAIEMADGDPSVGAGITVACPYAYCHAAKGGFMLVPLGELAEARRLIELGRELSREHGDVESVCWSHMLSVSLAYAVGDHEAAIGHARKAIEIAERIGDAFSRASAWFVLGWAEWARGEWRQAIEAIERSRQITSERGGAVQLEAFCLALLGDSYFRMGDVERARPLVAEGLELARSRGMTFAEELASLSLARVLLGSGDPAARDQVEATLARALQISQQTENKVHEPLIHVELAELARRRGDHESHKRELREALRLFTEIGATGHAERLAARHA